MISWQDEVDVMEQVKQTWWKIEFHYDFHDMVTRPTTESLLIVPRAEFEKLVESCRAFYDGFGDDQIEQYNNRMSKRIAESKKNSTDFKAGGGYVYLAHSETGQYKIGRSKSPPNRIKVFDTQMPINVTLVHFIWCDDEKKAEKRLHSRFSHKHHVGEWFNLDDEDVVSIRSLKGFINGTFR